MVERPVHLANEFRESCHHLDCGRFLSVCVIYIGNLRMTRITRKRLGFYGDIPVKQVFYSKFSNVIPFLAWSICRLFN